MTTIREARHLGEALLDEHDLSDWTLEFNESKTYAGQCAHRLRTIYLSWPYVKVNGLDMVRLTMLHEIAHALLPVGHGHDATWRKQCLAIGGDGLTRQRTGQFVQPKGSWLGTCVTDPAHTVQRHRKTAAMTEGTLFCIRCMRPGDVERGRIIWIRQA